MLKTYYWSLGPGAPTLFGRSRCEETETEKRGGGHEYLK